MPHLFSDSHIQLFHSHFIWVISDELCLSVSCVYISLNMSALFNSIVLKARHTGRGKEKAKRNKMQYVCALIPNNEYIYYVPQIYTNEKQVTNCDNLKRHCNKD